jgi:hypothetical protein
VCEVRGGSHAQAARSLPTQIASNRKGRVKDVLRLLVRALISPSPLDLLHLHGKFRRAQEFLAEEVVGESRC